MVGVEFSNFQMEFEAHCFQLCGPRFSQDPYIFSSPFVFPAVWGSGEAAPGPQLGESGSPGDSNMIQIKIYSNRTSGHDFITP